MTLIITALVINVLVAGFWGVFLLTRRHAAVATFGPDSPARRILACLYLAIAGASMTALVFPFTTTAVITTLFPLQIGYKLLTVLTLPSPRHPVAMSNLVITLLLAAAFVSTW
jgi:hypothetical protein